MNCKPGDLAWIVRTESTPELLGHIIEVIGPFNGQILGGLFAWEIRYPDGKPILGTYGECRLKKYVSSRPFADEFLRPIRPGDLHETEDDHKKVTA